MRLSERLQGLERIGQVNSHVASVVEIQQHLVDARDFLSDASRKGNTLRGRFGNANEIPAKSPTQRPKSSNGKTTFPGRKR